VVVSFLLFFLRLALPILPVDQKVEAEDFQQKTMLA